MGEELFSRFQKFDVVPVREIERSSAIGSKARLLERFRESACQRERQSDSMQSQPVRQHGRKCRGLEFLRSHNIIIINNSSIVSENQKSRLSATHRRRKRTAIRERIKDNQRERIRE